MLLALTGLNLQSANTSYLMYLELLFKETKFATINIFFETFSFLLKSFVKAELSYVFTINLFTLAEDCTEK